MSAPDLLEGLAAWAAARGHGVYRPDTAYQPGEVAIVLGDIVPASGELLAIRPYMSGMEPDARLPFDEPFVQWRVRGGPGMTGSRRRALDLADDLHGAGPLTLPNGVLVLSIIATHSGVVPLGRDDAGRYEHTVNTRVEYHRPSGLRRPL